MTAMKKPVLEKNISRILNPCPTVIVSARHKGKDEMCAVAWCMPADFVPAKVILVLAAGQATTKAVLGAGELVINVPGAELADKVLAVGQSSGKDRDKFRDFKLSRLPSRKVNSPGVKECLANLECRVLEQRTRLGRELRAKYDVILVEVLAARAESKAFTDRWLLENGVKLLHHLGSAGFEISGGLLTATAKSPG